MNILYINATVNPDSRTKRLAKYVLNKLNGNVKEINLEKEKIKPLDGKLVQKRSKLIAERNYNDSIFDYSKEFSKADIIVIAAPHWDLSFPATLKIYIEAINVPGITFAYSNEGKPYGLCKAKMLIYITTSGGEIISQDYGLGYIKSLAQMFYGIKDVICIKAENLDIDGADTEEILKNVEYDIDELFNQ